MLRSYSAFQLTSNSLSICVFAPVLCGLMRSLLCVVYCGAVRLQLECTVAWAYACVHAMCMFADVFAFIIE